MKIKISKTIKKEIDKMAILSSKIRTLSSRVLEYLEKKGIDIYCNEFNWAWAFIQGDCSSNEIVNYLEDSPIRYEIN